LDLLLFEGQECTSAELTLPHPRMFERDFVLIPLRDLYPEMKIYKKYNLVHYYDMLEENKTMKKMEF
jgi:2-amino-4-hydroxy-6-hydroxymethyldihydropteridine diphosphokinase